MMEKLDYHVTFPTKCTKTDNGDDAAHVDSAVKGGMNVPVVFLLGWYGCQDKHLAKYSALYESEGFVTIRYILAHDYIFGRKVGQVKDVALKVLDSFFTLGLQESPIFFHLFSNGGGFIYRHVSEILNGPSPGQYGSLRIAGIILDSTPARPVALRAFRVIYVVLSQTQHWIIAYLMSLAAFFILVVFSLLSRVDVDRDRRMYFDAMLRDEMPCPQLFLYSKGDRIVSYQDVQEVIAERRRRGFDVREVTWEDSDHVVHLRKHPEEYAASCREFVTNCLKKLDRELD